jgi:transposase
MEEGSMPRAYSVDLRERVLAACARGEGSRAAVAQRFSVGAATVYNWLRQAREEDRRAPKPHAGGPAPRLDAQGLAVLQELVARQNDATLAEHAERLAARTGVRVSLPTLCQVLRRLKLRRKKRRSGPASRSAPRSRRSALPIRPG